MMMTRDGEDLLRNIPLIRRARGWRLYTEKGRLIDLWQGDGAALLGHKPARLTAVFKAAMERGLYTALPSCFERRLYAALEKLFPAKICRLYQDDASLQHALKTCGYDAPPVLWRPFSDSAEDAVPLFMPVLPFALAPRILVAREDIAAQLPPSHLIPPVLLAAATQAVYALLAAPQRGNGSYPFIEQALEQSRDWTRDGRIYLYYRNVTQREWEPLFYRFLAADCLLPPRPSSPLILPGELSPGEEKQLAGLLQG